MCMKCVIILYKIKLLHSIERVLSWYQHEMVKITNTTITPKKFTYLIIIAISILHNDQ